jgi:hypothetical protein
MANRRSLSKKVYGPKLAQEVASHLDAGGTIFHGYRAYGFVRHGDVYRYEIRKDEHRVVFESSDRAAFTTWLATSCPNELVQGVYAATTNRIETPTVKNIREEIRNRAGVNDGAPYGTELAERVAAALDANATLAYDHRDYCGLGLTKQKGKYWYGDIHDGQPMERRRTFTKRETFVAWFAKQSDLSLCGRDEPPFCWDNQRVTRARVVEWLDDLKK